MSSNMKMAIGVILVLAAAFSRLIPHPMNFAPITAIALFGGMYFDKRFAPILPLAALMISDYFLGFYEGIVWVYGGFLLISVMGLFAARKRSFSVITGSTVAGSILFFVITNFGVWQSGVLYPMTMSGLTQCYIAAVPFFRNALVGDLFYSGVLFGSVALIEKYLPATVGHKA